MHFTTDYSPTSPAFRTLPAKELKEFFSEFVDNIQPCIIDLTKKIQETAGYESWEADRSYESLAMLDDWLSKRVQARSLTAAEVENIAATLQNSIEFRKEILTDETNSMVVKAGIYFGEVLIKTFSSLKWAQDTLNRNRKFADFGQPVIVGFKHSSMNPVRIVNTFAAGYAFTPKTERKLQNLFQFWANAVVP